MNANVAIVRPEGSTSWTKVDRDWTITANAYPELVGMHLFDVPGFSSEAEAQYRCVMETREPRSFRAFWQACLWDVWCWPDPHTGGVNASASALFRIQPEDMVNTVTLAAFVNRVSAALEAGVSQPDVRPTVFVPPRAGGLSPLSLVPPPE